MNLRRIYLDGIGHPSARFLRFSVNLIGQDDDVVDSLIWLRNGGGKTSLLGLFFSLFQPRVGDFLGSEDKSPRSLADYVTTGDTSHVIVEWEINGSIVLTGGVYEWNDRTRPVEYHGRTSLLNRSWWTAGVTGPAALDAVIATIAPAGKRATRLQFLDALRTWHRQEPRIGLAIAQGQGEWESVLRARGLDTDVFRYQKRMNVGEGQIASLFKFSSDAAFIDFLLSLTVSPEAAESLADRVRTASANLAQRPVLEADQAYCEEVHPLLEALGSAHQSRQERDERLRTVRFGGRRMARSIETAVEALRLEISEATELASRAREDLTPVRTERRRQTNYRLEYEWRAAALHHTDAERAVKENDQAAKQAAAEKAAWTVIGDVVELRRLTTRLQELEERLTALRIEAEPERVRHNRLIVVLDSRDAQRRKDAEAQCDTATQMHEQAGRDAKQARADAAQLRADAAVAKSTAARFDSDIAAHEERLTSARTSGLLSADESPADGLHRVTGLLEAARRDLEQLGELAKHRAQMTKEKQQRRGTAVREADRLDGEATAAASTAIGLRAEIDTFTGAERIVALAATDDIHLWTAADILARQLHDAVVGHDTRIGALTTRITEQRRDHDTIIALDRLPADPEVERIIGALGAAGVDAASGYAYLAQSVKRGDWDRVLAEHPALVDGVVAARDDIDTARATLAGAGLRPRRLVAVGAKRTLDGPGNAEGWVVPPHPALFDPQAAKDEATRLASAITADETELSAVRRARAVDQQLADTLADLMKRCPRGRLEELDRTAESCRSSAQQLRSEVADLDAELEQLEADQSSDEARRSELERSRVRLAGERPALERLADDDLKAGEWRTTAESQRTTALGLRTEAVAKDTAAAGFDTVEQTQRALAAAAGDKARDIERRRTSRRVAGTPYDGDIAAAVADEALRTDEELEASAAEALRTWEGTVSDEQLLAHRDQVEGEVGRSRRRLDVHLAETIARAEELLASDPDATSETGRFEAITRWATAELNASVALQQAIVAEHAWRLRIEERRPINGRVHRALDPGEEPADAADADARAAAAAAAAETLALRESALDEIEKTQSQRVEHATTNARLLTAHASRLRDVTGPDDADADLVEAFIGDEPDAKEAVERTLKIINEATTALNESVETETTATSTVRQIGRRENYRSVAGIRTRIDEDPDLASAAFDLAQEAFNRARVLADKIAAISADQQLLTTDLVGEVNIALRTLQDAERLSSLPSGLGEWSERSYLRIRFDRDILADGVELARRVDAYLSHIAIHGVPDASALVQRAVHAAVPTGFKVSVLKPNPGFARTRESVVAMGGWSGGEKLTAAVVLYCVLARLRARSKGVLQLSNGVGALVLDNPVGTANLMDFVRAQRLVAKLLGIQLVYTTAVNDLGVVAEFDNVIRARNIRAGGARGVIRVEDDDIGAPGNLAAARIVRPRDLDELTEDVLVDP